MFFKYNWEKEMKKVYPSRLKKGEYFRYLTTRSSCPSWILGLIMNLVLDPRDKRSIKAIKKWISIMLISNRYI